MSILLLATATLASAAGVVPCDGPGCRACDIVILGQNLLTWFIGIMASIITLMFAWGGMQMVMSAGNTGAVSAGREKMTNAVIGLVIILGAWLIVDTVLKVVMGGNIGVWNEVECVANPTRTATPPPSAATGLGVGPSGFGKGGAQCADGNTACSPSALMNQGFTAVQAQVMSCIAMTESAGNPNAINPKGNACGTFQVLPSNWAKLTPGTSCDGVSCTNAVCNAQIAKKLIEGRIKARQDPYGDWTCQNCNSKAQACIDKYGS